MIEIDEWKFFEYTIGGALVLIGLAVGIVLLIPIGIGYVIFQLALFIFGILYPIISAEKNPAPTENDLRRMAEQIERDRKRQLEEQREERRKAIEARLLERSVELADESGEEETSDETDEGVEEEREEFVPEKNIFLEKDLDYYKREELFARGYKRLKISPYGDGGAAYYWVRKRYNESKEHAFFCYLIEQELRKHTKNVTLFTNNGPDVVFEHDRKRYCFDVETGKSLSRQPEFLKKKFDYYREEYHKSFILVTRKSLKYRYAKFGNVITRSKLKKTIKGLFA